MSIKDSFSAYGEARLLAAEGEVQISRAISALIVKMARNLLASLRPAAARKV